MTEITDGWSVAHLVMHSAFQELRQASELAQVYIKVAETDPIQCFFVGGEVEQRRSASREHLVKATALFQAGMESLINHWQSKYPEIQGGNNFVSKWECSFTSKGVEANFDDYASFYREVRNAVIHPDTQIKIDTINNIEFLSIYQGIKYGWDASRRLASELGEPYDNNSWGTMCNIHGIPVNPEGRDYPNLTSLRAELYKRHLEELNKQHVDK